jgi:mRNA interferase MazF
MVRRGEVYWLELPDERRRPVCVLTRDPALPVLRNVTVALITRTVRDIPTEVPLTERDYTMPDD